MTFSESVITCFRKYVTFSGRATRSEFWWFVLFNMIVGFVIKLFDGLLFGGGPASTGSLGSLHSLVIFLPAISVQVRRLHDLNKSGWWYWMWLIPVIGWIALFVWNISEGSRGDNQFGPAPRNDAPEPSSEKAKPAAPAPEQPIKERESTVPKVKRNPTIRRRR